MSNSKSINIHIPHPCAQSWDRMEDSGDGRFCALCQTKVIDFTNWSDEAIYQLLAKKKNGETCGRFLNTQLYRPLTIPYQPHSRLYQMAIVFGLSLIFTQTPDAIAQNRPPKTEQSPLIKMQDTLVRHSGAIYGIVHDENKEPLISAVIQIYKGAEIAGGTITDIDGKYKISPLEPGVYDVVAIYAGYDSVILTSVKITGDSAEINLNFNLIRKPGVRIFNCTYGRANINSDIPTNRVFRKEELNQMPH